MVYRFLFEWYKCSLFEWCTDSYLNGINIPIWIVEARPLPLNNILNILTFIMTPFAIINTLLLTNNTDTTVGTGQASSYTQDSFLRFELLPHHCVVHNDVFLPNF